MLGNNIIDNLLVLLNTQSYSGEESEVAEMLVNFLPTLGFDVEQDDKGNVYAVRGDADYYPMLNAHMDSVRGYSATNYGGVYKNTYNQPKPTTCEFCKNAYQCFGKSSFYLTDTEKNSFCPSHEKLNYYTYIEDVVVVKEEEAGVEVAKIIGNKIIGNGTRPIGGDDKCGIAMALQIAIDMPKFPLKLFFSVGEEVGCVGSRYAIENKQSFFMDVKYCITIDRRGNSDLCLSSLSGKNGRHSFMRRLSDAYWCAGIVPKYVDGSSADVVQIRNVVYDCVNISCGYHDPHTTKETVEIEGFTGLYKMLNFFIRNYSTKATEFTRSYSIPVKVCEVTKPVVQTPIVTSTPQYPAITKMINDDIANVTLKGLGSRFQVVHGVSENYELIANALEYIDYDDYNNRCIFIIVDKKKERAFYLGYDESYKPVLVKLELEDLTSSAIVTKNLKLGSAFKNIY